MTLHVTREFLVPYLGQRPYVHITTLLSVVSPLTMGFNRLSLRVGKVMTCNRLTASTPGNGDQLPGSAACQCAWTDGRGRNHHRLIGEAGSPAPAARVAYDEEGIVEGWRMDGEDAVVGPSAIYTIYERIVALNKVHLQAIAPVGHDQQFLATRLDLTVPRAATSEIRIRHLRLIDGTHHASRIQLDGQAVGTIYFARHAKLRAPS